MNDDEKLQKLKEIKILLTKKIYAICLESNIDPDNFIYSNYINSSNESVMQGTLGVYCFKLDIIEKKIKELE